jgi:RecT family
MSEAIEIKEQPKQVAPKTHSFDWAAIKAMYAPTATPSQFEIFKHTCIEYHLSPLKNEIMFWTQSGKPYILKEGCFAIATRHDQFNGLQSGIMYKGDTLMQRQDGSYFVVPGEDHFTLPNTAIVGAYCNVYRKDQDKPTIVFSYMSSSKQRKQIWDDKPHDMILKTAEMHAIKKAFALNLDLSEGE